MVAGVIVIVAVEVFTHPFPSVPVTVYVAVPFTANAVPSVIPPLHTYDVAPLPLKVSFNPAHIGFNDAAPVTAGNWFTVTVAVEVFVQPFASVPVTV